MMRILSTISFLDMVGVGRFTTEAQRAQRGHRESQKREYTTSSSGRCDSPCSALQPFRVFGGTAVDLRVACDKPIQQRLPLGEDGLNAIFGHDFPPQGGSEPGAQLRLLDQS